MAGRPPVEAHEDVCRARAEHSPRAVLRGGLYGPRGLVLIRAVRGAPFRHGCCDIIIYPDETALADLTWRC